MRDIDAVILAGGQNTRMGKNKALLRFNNETFLERIGAQLTALDEVLLSVNEKNQYPQAKWEEVVDAYSQIGPMGGIYSALLACKASRLLTVSCDMPFFTSGLAEYMGSFVSDEFDAFVVVTRENRVQPLCAIYSKSAVPVLKKQIDQKNYRLIDALALLRTKRIPLKHTVYADETVQNINTPTEYASLLRQLKGPPVVAVSGRKNSGKTTLLTGIIPCLCREGLRVAVVKHDGHDFVPDVPGTDSFRLREAGAYGVAVCSQNRYMVTAEHSDLTIKDMKEHFPDADIILVEGAKHSDYPKIEVVRQENSLQPVCDPATLLALCSDGDLRYPEIPTLSLHDYDGIAQILLSYLRKETEL